MEIDALPQKAQPMLGKGASRLQVEDQGSTILDLPSLEGVVNRELEEAILRRAIEQGLISVEQLREIEAQIPKGSPIVASEKWGTRVALLIRKGLIAEHTVEALADEERSDREAKLAESPTLTVSGAIGSASTCGKSETLVSGESVPKTPVPDSRSHTTNLPAFSPNQLLAGRFNIVRFVAQGGMGEVYEAEDFELREHVALKTIRPEIAQDERAMERFKREIHLARKVTHPNVSRVFDVFHHRIMSPEGSASQKGEITFLTMEMLRGETLAERLRRTGRMTTAEAFPLVGQMAAALAAAHKVGVVHRDFKSGNVILVPTKEEHEEIRAVVTDFGLAHSSAASDSFAPSVYATGEFVGTPAYMAPEQVEGREITTATDIYALGVVMYEMVTGTQPFVGDTPLSALIKRLHEAPPSPRMQVPDLDAKWEVTIRRCLEPDPADRFADVADVVKALGGEEVAAGRGVRAEEQRKAIAEARKRRRWLTVVGITVILLLASAVVYHLRVTRQLQQTAGLNISGLPAAPTKVRRSIAVLGFKNLSGRPDAGWLSTALSEMLSTELAAGEKLRTIPGENVARMKIELSLADAETFAKETLARIRSNLGTDLVVLGSYLALGEKAGGQIRLDLRLQDAAAGETIASLAETGTEAQLLDLVSRTGARLREKLGAKELSAAEAVGVRASLPSGTEVARLYSEGLARLRVFDALAARDFLEKAVAADLNYPLAHSALAAAWSALGYDAKAKDEAKKSFDLAANLSREERLSVEGRHRETTREWEKAVEIYRILWNFFPDNLDYGLRLAAAQTSAGKGKDALATVEALRKLPPPAPDDPRIDLAEASAADSVSDYMQAQAAASKAAVKGEAQGARLLVARARRSEGRAFWKLGEMKRATVAFEDAKRIYSAAGDRGGVADALNNIAIVHADQGDIAGSKKVFEELLATYREIGNRAGMANASNNIAIVLYRQGDLAGAKTMFEESLAIRREIGRKQSVADSLSNIAAALLRQGDLAGSKKMSEESLAIQREIGNREGVVAALDNIGDVLRNQCDLSGAKTMFEEALAISREIGRKSRVAEALVNIADVLFDQGDLAGAKKMYEESLAISKGLGEKGTAATSRLALAELSIEEGRPAEAEAGAREAAEEYRTEKRVDNEASAHAILARSLLAQGKLAEARQASDRAAALSGKSQNRGVRLSVAITRARIRAASAKPPEATKGLEASLAEATKAGLLRLQFEARLALGEIEIKSSNPAAGRARLAALEQDSKAKGFTLIARKAAAARR